MLRIPDDAAGKQVRCPGCGTIQTVASSAPTGPAHPVPNAPTPPTLPELTGPQAPPPYAAGSYSASTNPFGEAFGASPFAAEKGEADPAQPISPYAPPQADSTWPSISPRQIATAKVRAPALLMIGLSVCGILFYLFALVAGIGGAVGRANGQWNALGALAQFLIPGVLHGVILYGAVSMLKLQRYGFAMAAAILTLLPCGVCCVVGMPTGIWALVVLNETEVRTAFDRPA